MRPGGGKTKGGSFEREVCHLLSLWISHGARDDLLWRSSNSGGRATVVFKKGGANRTQCGDITAIDPAGNVLTDPFLISCKFYRTLDLEGAVKGNKGGLSAFWEEAVNEAKRHNKLPILVAKQNNTKPFVGLSPEGAKAFGIENKWMVWLPIAGGLKMFWLEKFLQIAKVPGESKPPVRRPTILNRPRQ